MTAQVPYALDTTGETAETFRRLDHAEWGRRGGPVTAGAMKVTQNTTPGMSVNVAPGQIVVPGLEGAYQGSYLAENRGVLNVPIAAAPAAPNSRSDLVIIRVEDAAYSGSDNGISIEVLQGTPNITPAAPTPTGTYYVLAQLLIYNGTVAVTNANILDQRFGTHLGLAVGVAGTIVSVFDPAAVEGRQIYRTDTDQVLLGDSVPNFVDANTLGGGAWTTYAATVTEGGLVAATVTYAKYQKVGRTVFALVNLAITGSGTAGQPLQLAWPLFPAAAGSNVPCGVAYWYNADGSPSVRNQPLIAVLASGGVRFLISSSGASDFLVTGGLANGDVFTAFLRYESLT